MISELISYSITDISVFFLIITLFRFNISNYKWIYPFIILTANVIYEMIITFGEHNQTISTGVLIIIIFLSRRFIIISILCKKISNKILYISLLSLILHQTYSTLLKLIFPEININLRILIIGILESIIIFLFIILINKNIFVYDFINRVPKKVYLLLLLALWVFILYLSINEKYENAAFYSKIHFTLTFLMIIMIFIITIFFIRIVYNEIRNKDIFNLLTIQVEGQVKYYQKLVDLSYDLKSVQHDLKNHMICLGSLIESGNINEALEYIKDITEISQIKNNGINTGNVIIDSLLNEKCKNAEIIGALIDFNGFVPTQGITNTNLCIIFFNAIDNAIEACSNMDENIEKIIKINSDFRQGYYFINFKNPFLGKIDFKNDVIISTTKTDKNLHGYGLSNIFYTVKRLGGEIRTCEIIR